MTRVSRRKPLWRFANSPTSWACRPVSRQAWVGEHDGTGLKTCVKSTPSRATRSNVGVRAGGSPSTPVLGQR